MEPLVFVRIGLCLILLFRQENLFAGFIDLEHHSWGTGPEFGPSSLAPLAPSFAPPLLPGFDALLPASDLLCRMRLVVTWLLLFGLFRRANAALLFLVCFSLFAADGLRYLHHLFILYVSVLFLALPHGGPSKSGGSNGGGASSLPLATLALRAHVQVVYFAAGLAKCAHSWLSGSTLRALHENGFATGQVMESAVQVLGYAPLSWGACLTELSIPVLLIFKRTRLYAAFLALGLHGFIHSTILVSTFGVTMLVLLGAFLPTPEEQKGRGGVTRGAVALAMGLAVTSPLAARLASTGVGSYTMFTKLSFYELEMRLDGQIFPRRRLAPHLGRDGARIVRLANGRGIGETNLEILGRALPELARFLCALEPETDRVQLKLTSRRIEGGTGSRQLATHNCSRH